MGFFSWNTADTFESIPNCFSDRETFTVFVLCPDGRKIKEDCYEGYGEFGSEDIYALLANWNCPEKCNGNIEHDRKIGIEIGCYNKDMVKLKYPLKIVKNANLEYNEVESFSKSCKHQGYFLRLSSLIYVLDKN